MPDSFDRDATKKALEWWENSLSLPGRAGREMAGDQLAEAARWAVQITEGDGLIWYCAEYGDIDNEDLQGFSPFGDCNCCGLTSHRCGWYARVSPEPILDAPEIAWEAGE